ATASRSIARPNPHQQAPLLDALRGHLRANTVAFSTPGQKGRAMDAELGAVLGIDAFRADVWLNTAEYDTALRAAEALAADAWNADDAYFLVNGSSSGNHALLMALLRPGDKVIVGRDAHMSVLSGLILAGAEPVYVSPDLDPT